MTAVTNADRIVITAKFWSASWIFFKFSLQAPVILCRNLDHSNVALHIPSLVFLGVTKLHRSPIPGCYGGSDSRQRKRHSTALLTLCEENIRVACGFMSQRGSNEESVSTAGHHQSYQAMYFRAQRGSDAKSVSMSWHHHIKINYLTIPVSTHFIEQKTSLYACERSSLKAIIYNNWAVWSLSPVAISIIKTAKNSALETGEVEV